MLCGFQSAHGQATIDVGGIMTVHYLDGGGGKSPLSYNTGLPGFEMVADLFLNVHVTEEASIFIELETLRNWNVQLYSGALTYKILGERLQVEAGKFVAPFGNFLPRRFAPQNFLYAFPLYYEYRTGLATNRVPTNNRQLLEARGTGRGEYKTASESAHAALPSRDEAGGNQRGDLFLDDINFPAQPATGHIASGSDGVKLVAKEAYLSGVQFFGKLGRLGYSVGLANGALSNPTTVSVSKRPMVFGRLNVQPVIGLNVGISGASGSYLNHELVRQQMPDLQSEKFAQHVAGVDVEYSRGYWVFFGEGSFSRWETPFITEHLDAWAFTAEMRYKLLPRLYVAARYGRISFSEIADENDIDGDGERAEPWEFSVWRLESALGFHLSRHALLKTVWQINRTAYENRLTREDPDDDLAAIQLTVFY
jgi:hypothetical protein